MKLDSIAKISSGPNSMEIRKHFSKSQTYSNNDLEKDLYQGYHGNNAKYIQKPIVKAGDLLLNTMSYNAGIVSKQSEGKVMPQNLIRLIFNNSKVYNWYLCYVLNESQSIKHQIYRSMEGSIMRRLTTSSIKALDIKLPNFYEQNKIGEIYRHILIQDRLTKEYTQQLKNGTLSILNIKDINGGK